MSRQDAPDPGCVRRARSARDKAYADWAAVPPGEPAIEAERWQAFQDARTAYLIELENFFDAHQ